MVPLVNARIAAACTVAALGFAGCGGDDGTETPASRPADGQTRERFIAEGDALCARVNTKVEAYNARIQRAAGGSTSAAAKLEAIAPIFREAHQVQRQALREWQALEQPEDEDVIDQLDTAYSEQAALVGRIADAAAAGDAAGVSSLSSQIELVRNRAKGLAQGYGFRVCGSRDQ